MSTHFSETDSELIAKLQEMANSKSKKRALVKTSSYQAPADPAISINSWKLDEFRYYDVPSPFPTLARGLFTHRIDVPKDGEKKEAAKYRVVARGYDKFFNIGEVPWTKWEAIENHTVPPYALTLKSNGCIIFFAALTPSKLLVTSKHSLGPIVGQPMTHAEAGEAWLHRHLEKKGKNVEQLADVLHKNNWTAIAELCDDSFEEHVLPYSSEKTGLHLHGINYSTGAFRTMTPEVVAQFAREWGFIETPAHTVKSVSEVRSFTEDIGKTGKWNGESVEGFVVRCHTAQHVANKDLEDVPPYPPGSSFFFKVKFDEPYMMYRDWREITKILLSSKPVPKSKLRRTESEMYKLWVEKEIAHDKKQFADFGKGKGIIATRERFLKWMESEGSLKKLNGKQSDSKVKDNAFDKTIIVPIAIPGCGKTTIAVALRHLFGFGHTQSDDVHVKKPAPTFLKNVREELKKHDVVIADKNNHLRRHREDLRKLVFGFSPPVRLLALNWSLDKPPAIIHRICGDRVMERGDNHQTLRADAVTKSHEEVIWKFLNTTEELADEEVDEVIDMDVEEDLEQGLDRAIDGCVRILHLQKPTREQIGEALAVARAYVVEKKKANEAKKESKEARYYGILPELDIEQIVEERLSQDDVSETSKKMWEAFKKEKRITTRPHVTIVHSKCLPQEQELWDSCKRIFLDPTPPMFEFKLGNILLNERVMAITVDDFNIHIEPENDIHEEGLKFVEELDDPIKTRLHITVGTISSDIPPIEAKALVDSWKGKQTDEKVFCIKLEDIKVKGRIKVKRTLRHSA